MNEHFWLIFNTTLSIEDDIVLIRQKSRHIAQLLGFQSQDQTRIATAVSEIARNAFQYAGRGQVEISLKESVTLQSLSISIQDKGPGIVELEKVLDGTYHSKTGLGLGIHGAQKLMDLVLIESQKGLGTRVLLEKFLPSSARRIKIEDLKAISKELSKHPGPNSFKEVERQNQEILKAMDELQKKQDELASLNRELENTNRGVVALYAELDEKAQSLKKVSETKTNFLSNMTHEFRTPLNSILNISSLLLDPQDGVHDVEHQKQVQFIRKSAEDLSNLVNDLLDIAKIEAGKITIRPAEFQVTEFLGALKGLMKPLLNRSSQVNLTFEVLSESTLYTDEGKLAQILRNLISNALKFTEKGEVKVSALPRDDQTFLFLVSDTGIGIDPKEHVRIFEEFSQIESPLQCKTKGTGLGLPLASKLTHLLGGEISVKSQIGSGSTFQVVLPTRYHGPAEASYVSHTYSNSLGLLPKQNQLHLELSHSTVLVIDDDESARYFLSKALGDLALGVIQAKNGLEGIQLAQEKNPKFIFLDLDMPDLTGYQVLSALMTQPSTRNIPVAIYTSKEIDLAETEYINQVTLGVLPKKNSPGQDFLNQIKNLLTKANIPLVRN